MKYKKILFLSPLPPPYYGSSISSEICLKILKNSKKFEVKNIKLNYSMNMEDIGKININKIKGFFRVKKEIKKSIQKFNPDVIYMVPATSYQGISRDYLFAREIKKNWKGKILFHIRSRIAKEDWKNYIKRYLLKELLKNQRAIILGKELAPDLHNLINKKDIYILPNAIKNEISNKKVDKIIKKRRKNQQFNILFLSNMNKEKGWPKLLEACKILNEKKIKFRCDFIGAWQSSSDKIYFNNFIKKHNLEKRIFTHGEKTGKEKNKFLEKANLLVFPTEYKLETFGRVIIEAMMFGIPVIANGIASITSIIKNNEVGFILKENSPKEIAEKLEKLYNNKELGIKIGKAGRKRFLKYYEIKDYSKKFLEIFKKV